jgi:ADP-ribosyl-[dinitrogen reductase] hydrolase
MMITLTDLPGLLSPVIGAAETAGQMLAAEFARRGGPRAGGGQAEVDAEIVVMLRQQLLALLPARLLQHARAMQISGGSYRLKDTPTECQNMLAAAGYDPDRWG